MRNLRFFLMVTVISVLMISACAPQIPAETPTAVPASTVEPVTPVPTGENTVEPLPDGQMVVTLDDRGKTISMAVGESFLLKLGEQYTWEVTVSDEAVLSRVKNIAVIRGAQGVYQANQPGTATLSASGDPVCRQSQPPCGMPSILVDFTVVVK